MTVTFLVAFSLAVFGKHDHDRSGSDVIPAISRAKALMQEIPSAAVLGIMWALLIPFPFLH